MTQPASVTPPASAGQAARDIDTIDRRAIQRRTVTTLMGCQVLGGAAVSSAVAVNVLLAKDILHSGTLAGLAGAALHVGSALASVQLAMVMRRRGRRPGMRLGYLTGALGGVITIAGGQWRSLPLLLLGIVLFGAGQSAGLQGRYAAADLAHPDRRGQAISTVVWVGTLGAVFGPTLIKPEKAVGRGLGLRALTGPLLFAVAYFVVAAVLVTIRLRPDPLVVAGGVSADVERPRRWRNLRHSIDIITASPPAKLALVAMIVSQSTMVAVMTMTPLHMTEHGHSAELSGFVISVHIAGMYGFAPAIGWLSDRAGRYKTILAGGALLASATVFAALAGYEPSLLFASLFLLGVGWNFGLISGSALLTESVAFEHRVDVQGSADLLMSMCGALAAFSSGLLRESLGYHMLANIGTVAAIGLVIATVATMRLRDLSRPAVAL